MSDYDVALATMDDDGAGSAITSTPERGEHGVWCACAPSECPVNLRPVRDTLARRYGSAVPVTAEMVRAVMAGLEV